eukprot:10979052-Lingulodinium_polyedra.AAC.1
MREPPRPTAAGEQPGPAAMEPPGEQRAELPAIPVYFTDLEPDSSPSPPRGRGPSEATEPPAQEGLLLAHAPPAAACAAGHGRDAADRPVPSQGREPAGLPAAEGRARLVPGHRARSAPPGRRQPEEGSGPARTGRGARSEPVLPVEGGCRRGPDGR